jgi:bifunctional non-homologous end joining protein LigD
VFVRWRADKVPEECVVTRPTPMAEQHASVGLKISNAQKVLFPDDGITKEDIVNYYRSVARWMVPYLKDRPLMLTRYPDGIFGKNFFQKAVPLKAPSFVRTVSVKSDEDGRVIEQIVCDDVQTLEWCANLAALPLHIPATRLSQPDKPDWAVIDFDPKGAPWTSVVTLAQALHELCERAGLPSFLKTSGSSGLHVLVPLGGQLDTPGAKQLAELLAQLVVAAFPKLATVERSLSARGGRVYVDALQNGAGKLLVAPFAVRALPKAPVSMPVAWEELPALPSARAFTVANAVARLEKQGDCLADILSAKVNLAAAVGRLTGRSG